MYDFCSACLFVWPLGDMLHSSIYLCKYLLKLCMTIKIWCDKEVQSKYYARSFPCLLALRFVGLHFSSKRYLNSGMHCILPGFLVTLYESLTSAAARRFTELSWDQLALREQCYDTWFWHSRSWGGDFLYSKAITGWKRWHSCWISAWCEWHFSDTGNLVVFSWFLMLMFGIREACL